MRSHAKQFRTGPAALKALLLITACSTAPVDPAIQRLPDGGAIVFLSQKTPANVSMMALFTGTLGIDQAGCLRLNAPNSATAVWPAGSTLRVRDNGVFIHDRSGKVLGRLGSEMTLGGGEVDSIQHLELTASERPYSPASCPGKFWIVAEH